MSDTQQTLMDVHTMVCRQAALLSVYIVKKKVTRRQLLRAAVEFEEGAQRLRTLVGARPDDNSEQRGTQD